MLQRAASSAYSWWWASHIRTKQSKWLEQNLQDMEDKVGSMLGIIDEDGDSFARRAEMYYRKRPELVHLVEESFRAYRALAERYDHISKDLQSANRTIATVYPEKVHFSGMDDDDDDEDEEEEGGKSLLKKSVKAIENGKLKPPIPNVPPIKSFKQLPTFKTKKWTQAQQQQKLKRTISSAKPLPCSGLTKGEALEEIDKLQKGILVLQTEKEFVKSIYETVVAKYLEIESRINEMQVKVCGLQDEFGIGTVIEDNVARKLMVSTALKSCQETLSRLKEKQEMIVQEASMEQEKIADALQKFKAFKVELCGEQSDIQELGELTPEQAVVTADSVMPALQSLEEKMKELEDADANKSLTVSDLVDKIDDIVDEVVKLETAVASSTAIVQRLRSEADELQEHVQALESDEVQMAEDSNVIRQKMVELEAKMARVHHLKQTAECQNTSLISDFNRASNSLVQLGEKVENLKFDEMDEIAGWNVGGKYDNEQLMSAGKHSKISVLRKGEKFLDVVSQVLSTSSTNSKPGNSPNAKEEGQNSESDGQCHENIMFTANGLGISDDSELEQTKSEHMFTVFDEPEGSCTGKEHADGAENGNSGVEGENRVEDHESRSPNKVLETTVFDQSPSAFDAVNDEVLPEDSQLGALEKQHIVANEEQQVRLALPEPTNQDQLADTPCHSVDESLFEHQTQEQEDGKRESGLYADSENSYQEWMESVIPDGETNAELDSPSDEQENEKLKGGDGRTSWRKLVENKEGELDWRRLFLSGLEDREKFLVDEYTSVIKTLKEARRKLSEVEKKNREGLTEQASKMKQIMQANSLKDKEIQSLRRTVSLLKLNNSGEKDGLPLPDTSQSEQNEDVAPSKEPELLISELEQRISEDAAEETQPTRFEINLNDEPQMVSTLEEKFRSDLDEMLGENLEFWLRFCTSVHQIQKFQSSVEDLQIEAARLLESKKQGTNSKNLETLKSDAKPIYKHLKDIQDELNLWLQHNSLLKEELESRHSSLSDIEEDITRVSNVTEDTELSEYQAAKFQGEVANMKQENNKVSDELQSCIGRVKKLETDIDKLLFKLNEEFGISESERKHSRTRVPLRTFLFGVKLKKQKHSFFRCISPSLQKQYSDLASQYPPPR